MRFISSMPSGKKEFRLKGFISLEEINLSRQKTKQNYGFYLFDKSWYLPAKHVIYNRLLSCYHTYYCVGIISVTSVSHCVTPALRNHPCYQSRSLMYIRDLISWSFEELSEAVPIACGRYHQEVKRNKILIS